MQRVKYLIFIVFSVILLIQSCKDDKNIIAPIGDEDTVNISDKKIIISGEVYSLITGNSINDVIVNIEGAENLKDTTSNNGEFSFLLDSSGVYNFSIKESTYVPFDTTLYIIQDTMVIIELEKIIEDERISVTPILPAFVFKKTDEADLLAYTPSIIYKSMDNGFTWEKYIWYYDYETSDIHGNIYAINTDYYLCKSEDNCQSWKQLEVSNNSFPGWRFFANSYGHIIKSYGSDDTPDDIYFVDINSYLSRKIFTSQGDFIEEIFLASNNYIFCFADEKLYRSKDDGNNWNEIELEIDFRNSYRVGMIESKQPYIYLIIQNLIFYSADFGNIWEKVSTEFDNIELQFVDNNNNIFFYSSSSNFGSRKLFVTYDNFNTWVNIPLDDNPSTFGKLFVDNNIIYLPLKTGGLQISNDMGQTWIEPKWYEE